MTLALLETLKTVVTEVKRNRIEDAVGSSWAALSAEEGLQGRGIGTLLVEAGARGGGGQGEGAEGGGGGVEQREQWEDPLATQRDRKKNLRQTNPGLRGVYMGVVPRAQ